ncbi:type II toxin-antitoxin system PemK/MazF family toxin [Rippkaea orientalis]|nr:type II toxin-antitoxin system PemK/MazF family toxin [Rippkaea orientalis]
MRNYKRGEVWLVDLGYVAKIRPCLIVSIPTLQQVEP